MNEKKQVIMVMPVMKGGGAERVAALLMNEFYKNNYNVEFILTSSKKDDVINRDLNENIPLSFIRDMILPNKNLKDYIMKFVKLYASFSCRVFEAVHKEVPGYFAYVSFVSQYYKEIAALRDVFKKNPEATIVSFLQPAIPMVLLAASGLPNKVICSERGNPRRLMKHRYGRQFIKKYYQRAAAIVFQTEDAMKTYPTGIKEKGIIIPNPIKPNLLDAYIGERNKTIMTFCRISTQKNLPLLVNAFIKFHIEHAEYRLRIIGDVDKGEEYVKSELIDLINDAKVDDSVEFIPFSSDVHQIIQKDGMYVNSSNYEGMSNAMLEAMALGIPTICTDCPIGGARATIQNETNGLLVPVNDEHAMYVAMKKIAEDRLFREKISKNGIEIRQRLAVETIAKKWMELL